MKADKERWSDYLTFRKVNKVIRYLTISDFLIISSFGLIAPIFAVFITDTIVGGTLAVVGIAEAVYLLTKSLCQIPIAGLVDKIKGEKDDFWAMIIGSIGFSIMPLFYLIVNIPLELYIVQFFYGLFTALALPTWMAIFTRHIDRKHEGMEWGIYQTLVDLGAAAAASIGGFIAYQYGFSNLFIFVCIFSFIGTAFLAGTYKSMKTGKILFKD